MITREILAAMAAICVGVAAANAAPPASTMAPDVERIVVVRHGEKPEAGLGQLDCRGLARSLALPDVIIKKYGMPQTLFAPNPTRRKLDRGQSYNYIRPLATIEPLAIRAGLSVDLRFGYGDAAALAHALESPVLAGQLIVVAWEHKLAVTALRELLRHHGGDHKQVADWDDGDFDRMDVVEITRSPGQRPVATYRRDAEGLGHMSGECPTVKVQ